MCHGPFKGHLYIRVIVCVKVAHCSFQYFLALAQIWNCENGGECFAVHKILNPCIAGSVKGTWERGFYREVRGN